MSINDYIDPLKDLRVPTLLIGAGIVFIGIAIIGGGILGSIQIPRIGPRKSIGLFIVGVVFLFLGIILAATPTVNPPPEKETVTSTPPPTSKLYVEVPLSDGRKQVWWTELHAHWIHTKWLQENGNWSKEFIEQYPPSQAGAMNLDGYINNGITYFTVKLDDGTCWQLHKLTTNPNDAWTTYYRCN